MKVEPQEPNGYAIMGAWGVYALRSHFISFLPPSALGRGGNIGRLYAAPGRVRLAAAPTVW